MMKRVHFTDSAGRKFISLLPEGVPESKAEIGVILGPPDLSPLGLPLDIEVRLNNALFARNLVEKDRVTMADIRDALLAVFKVDALKIAALY